MERRPVKCHIFDPKKNLWRVCTSWVPHTLSHTHTNTNPHTNPHTYTHACVCARTHARTHTHAHAHTHTHTHTHPHISVPSPRVSTGWQVHSIAFVVSFDLNLQAQSQWSLFNGTWQKRHSELDHWLKDDTLQKRHSELDYRLRFEIEKMTLQMQ